MNYNINAVYWIFIQAVLGQGSAKLVELTRRFGSARAFCECRPDELKATGLLSRGELARFERTTLEQCYGVIDRCANLGYGIITPNDKLYPKRLAQIPNPPAVLYVKGEFPNFDDEVAIGMVGTRKCSAKGKSIARELAYRLSEAGATVVSGGAVGIDSSSHIGAIRAGGKTYAVLGCGINYPYLAVNAELRRDISENGALISEYPPDEPASRATFPIRNRIISGLCLGTVVVEATRSSGSLITVDHALEQGRDIFVIPGEISDPLYAGSNRLIRDGAIAVITPSDILCEYNAAYPHKLNLANASNPITFSDPPVANTADELPVRDELQSGEETQMNIPVKPVDLNGLTPDARLLYEKFSVHNGEAFDAVTDTGELSSPRAISALSELEIMGYIKALPGGRYTLNRNL